jgi:hypothetical protein
LARVISAARSLPADRPRRSRFLLIAASVEEHLDLRARRCRTRTMERMRSRTAHPLVLPFELRMNCSDGVPGQPRRTRHGLTDIREDATAAQGRSTSSVVPSSLPMQLNPARASHRQGRRS